MGKTSTSQQSSKSMIARDKLSDDHFDQLVIDTSLKVSQRVNLLTAKQLVPDATDNEKLHLDQITQSLQSEQQNDLKIDQPKRPMNAFMVWGQAIRRELHDKFSNVQNALLSKALGRVWRTLDATQKEPYVRKANLIKANHKRDYPNYRYRPRRIQERRTRCNMLIGIHLDHPVNQQQKMSSTGFERCSDRAFALSGEFARDSYSSHTPNDDLNSGFGLATRQAPPWSGPQQCEFSCTEGKLVDGVQKFEYQPYPYNTSLTSSTSHSNITGSVYIQQTSQPSQTIYESPQYNYYNEHKQVEFYQAPNFSRYYG